MQFDAAYVRPTHVIFAGNRVASDLPTIPASLDTYSVLVAMALISPVLFDSFPSTATC